jgi:hypothetical protein
MSRLVRQLQHSSSLVENSASFDNRDIPGTEGAKES